MRHRTLWAAIVAYFRNFRLNSAKDSFEDAIKRRCHLEGLLEERLSLASFYKAETAAIDPWKDHHGFADSRQKYLDAKDDCVLIREKLDRQLATVIRCREHLNRRQQKRIHPLPTAEAIAS